MIKYSWSAFLVISFYYFSLLFLGATGFAKLSKNSHFLNHFFKRQCIVLFLADSFWPIFRNFYFRLVSHYGHLYENLEVKLFKSCNFFRKIYVYIINWKSPKWHFRFLPMLFLWCNISLWYCLLLCIKLCK